MIKSKYGPDMVTKDREDLDAILEDIIQEVGPDYGVVLEAAIADISDGHYSRALKYNASNRTSWFLKYVSNFVKQS